MSTLTKYTRDEFLTPFDRLFDDVFNNFGVTPFAGSYNKVSYPKVDVVEYSDRYELEADLARQAVAHDGDLRRRRVALLRGVQRGFGRRRRDAETLDVDALGGHTRRARPQPLRPSASSRRSSLSFSPSTSRVTGTPLHLATTSAISSSETSSFTRRARARPPAPIRSRW